jgi:outer membrane protein OmpA-like peptidoglycan-associated protein
MFATDKSEPLIGADADRAFLRAGVARLSDWLGKHADAKVLIEGHSDSQGTEAHNLVLSFARAKAVSTLIGTNGIPANRQTVRAAGAGEAALKIDRRDRRVDVGIDGVNACKSATGATEQHP